MGKKGLRGFDRALFELTDKYLYEIVLAILLVLSVIVRIYLTPELRISGDFRYPNMDWVTQYRELGMAQGLSRVIGDYYVPFNIWYALIGVLPFEPLYTMSFMSCVFDYLLAYVVYLILREVFVKQGVALAAKKAAVIASLTLFLPPVLMNSALWKQCDAVHLFFAFLAVYYLLFRERPAAAFVLLGISFAFKPQAVFFMPLFATVYFVRRNFSLLQFLWIPVMYLIAGLPAVLLGRGIRATYLTYFNLVKSGNGGLATVGMVANYPNFYVFGLDDFTDTLTIPATLIALAVLGLSLALAVRMKDRMTNERLLLLLAWQIVTCCMLMPAMHERYDYPAGVLFFMLLFTDRAFYRASILPACVINVGTVINYTRIFLQTGVSYELMAVVYIAMWLYMTTGLVRGILHAGD